MGKSYISTASATAHQELSGAGIFSLTTYAFSQVMRLCSHGAHCTCLSLTSSHQIPCSTGLAGHQAAVTTRVAVLRRKHSSSLSWQCWQLATLP